MPLIESECPNLLQCIRLYQQQTTERNSLQQGLRVGLIISDETTTLYSPTPRLIEAGGQPGERLNALRLDVPILPSENPRATDFESLDLHTHPVHCADVERTAESLNTNPPVGASTEEE